MIKDKRGAHIEIIISFAVFVTFLIFIYYIVNPVIMEPSDKEYLLNNVKTKIKDDTSSILRYDTINVKKEPVYCFAIEEYKSNRVKIKDEDGQSITAQLEYGLGLLINSDDTEIYRIYYSDHFGEVNIITDSGCELLTEPSGYNLIEEKSSQYIFLNKIEELETDYNEDYAALKDQFSIPDGTDFAFSFLSSNKETIGVGQQPIKNGVNVYSEEMPIQYINPQTGDIQDGFLTVKIW